MTEKSHQNDEKGRKLEPSAGDMELTARHCPPDMTEAVKSALEKEIADFKQDVGSDKRLSAPEQVRKDAEDSATGGRAVSAYENWVSMHGGEELPEANPDVISDEEGLKYTKTRKDGKLAKLLLEFRESLTPRQRQVWNLVMKNCMNVSEAAALLNLSRSTVQDYLNQAKVKFQKFGEAIRDARK